MVLAAGIYQDEALKPPGAIAAVPMSIERNVLGNHLHTAVSSHILKDRSQVRSRMGKHVPGRILHPIGPTIRGRLWLNKLASTQPTRVCLV